MNAPHNIGQLRELLSDFETAMLSSHTLSGQMRSRPMHIADVTEDGRIWFVCGAHSGKIDEFERDSRVAIVLQSSKRFVSITGQAFLVEDPERLAAMWKRAWSAWFPGGPESAEIQLLAVRPEVAEFWDVSGAAGLRYAFAAAKALVTGERIDSEALEHGTMRL
ncbi:MAG: pyridoxamine 5'-phosphate oxidase family protein [Planctomycetota bacterium]